MLVQLSIYYTLVRYKDVRYILPFNESEDVQKVRSYQEELEKENSIGAFGIVLTEII